MTFWLVVQKLYHQPCYLLKKENISKTHLTEMTLSYKETKKNRIKHRPNRNQLAMQTEFSSVLITLKIRLQYRIIIQFDIS